MMRMKMLELALLVLVSQHRMMMMNGTKVEVVVAQVDWVAMVAD